MIRSIMIVMILGILLSGCAPIDPQLAEQIRLHTPEAHYTFEPETPLCFPFLKSYPAKSIIPDPQPSFLLDPTTAWTMSFGRGGGPIGYNMVRMDEQGTVQLLYHEMTGGKKGLLTLSAEDISAFIEYLNTSPLFEMPKAYHAALYDGDHWAVIIQQGVQRKTLSFHNHFPEAIIEFAKTVDRLLIKNGLFEMTWETISWDEADRYERTLWE